jgi:hypothetical protein
MSKTYLYIRRQNGGCDYTIGCGISIEEIRAKSLEDAIDKIIDLPKDWKESWDEDMIYGTGLARIDDDIDGAELIEITSSTDIMPILQAKLKEVKAFQEEAEKKVNEDIERKKYEELKKKFEKKGK